MALLKQKRTDSKFKHFCIGATVHSVVEDGDFAESSPDITILRILELAHVNRLNKLASDKHKSEHDYQGNISCCSLRVCCYLGEHTGRPQCHIGECIGIELVEAED